MADYIIANGENLFWYGDFKYNDTILVQSGGALGCVDIPRKVLSVTLEDGAFLSGWLKTGRELNVQGTVFDYDNYLFGFYGLSLTLDISERMPEEAIMINDCSKLEMASLSLAVNHFQSEGTYRLLGNAAVFSETIMVLSSNEAFLGSVSLDNPEFDYGINHYTLHLNEADELCLTASSSIPEGVKILLFKDEQLVDDSLPFAYDVIFPSESFDQMVVLSGGLANGLLVNEGGMLTVLDGGVAGTIHIDSGGTLEVLSGGIATDVVVEYLYGGDIRVVGGIIDGLRVDFAIYGNLYVGESGIIRNFGSGDYGVACMSLIVGSGGRMENGILSGLGYTLLHENIVAAGGTIYRVILVDQCSVYGTAYETELKGSAGLYLKDGGHAYGTVLNHHYAEMTVTGADAYNTEVRIGSMHVSSGGTVRDTRLNAQYTSFWKGDDEVSGLFGEIVVSEGGLSLDTMITAGTQTVKMGGMASRTELCSAGHMIVNGGLASETVLTDGGFLEVKYGGVVRDVHAVRDAAIKVGADGEASSVLIDDCNLMVVTSKGRAVDVNVASGGEVYLQKGAVLGGRMQLAEGAVVYAFDSSVIDFDLSKANSSTALLNDLSMIGGTPGFSITVSADIAAGVYLLADGAAGFAGTISVQDDRFYYGDLTISDPLSFGWNTYSLNLNNGTLSVTVTRNASEVPVEGIPLEPEMIYGVNVEEGETLTLPEGYTYYEVGVNSGGTMNVQSGAKLEKPTVNIGGTMTVLDGGGADNIFITSGTLNVLSGGKVSNVICDSATVRVEGGEIDGIKRADLNPYEHWFGELSIGVDGTVRNAELYDLSTLDIESNGLLEDSTLLGPGWSYGWELVVTVNAGGSVNRLSVKDASKVMVYGVANNTELCGDRAGLYLKEGGQASGTLVNYINAEMTLSGAVASASEVRRGAIHVSSGGTIKDTKLYGEYSSVWNEMEYNYDWTLEASVVVSEGGLSLDTLIAAGSQTVKQGAIANKTELRATGRMLVNGGLASETELTDGGQLTVLHGGVAKDVHAVRNGGIEIGRDGTASSVVLDAYNTLMVSGGGHAEDVNVASGGEVYLQDGAVLGGHMHLAKGAIVYAFEGGTIDFDLSKANSSTALLNDLSVIGGTPGFTITVSADTAAGTYLLADGAAGFAGAITVQDDTMRYGDLSVNAPLIYGWNTYTLNLNAGTLFLTVTRNASEAPSGGVERPSSDKTIYAMTVQEGENLSVFSGYKFSEAIVNGSGILNVQSGARIEDSLVSVSGTLLVQGGTADSIEVFGGTLGVLNGGTVTNVYVSTDGETVRDNGIETICVIDGIIDGYRKVDNGYAVGTVYVGENGIIRNANLGTVGMFTVESGGLVEKTCMASWMGQVQVLAGGTVKDLTNTGGEICIYGLALNTSVTGGSISLKEGGQASGTVLSHINVEMTLSGAHAVDTVVESGTIHVSGGGTIRNTLLSGRFSYNWNGNANETTWDANGNILVSEGGLSVDTTIAGGCLTIKRGGIASRTDIVSTGQTVVMNGGLTSETVLSNGGRLIVSRGGVAKDVHAVRDGIIMVESDGVVSSAVLESFNMMMVSSGGRAEDVNISSKGEMYLMNGAVLGGHMQLAEGAVVSVEKGGRVEFDLSKANATAAMLNNLSAITGSPDFTITVSADTGTGTYRLADGAAGFAGTITVRDDEKRYGDLSVNESLVYGWNTYTLNLVNGALSLSIAKNSDYVEPSEEDDTEIIVTSGSDDMSGETLVWEKTGETVRVTSGGILQNTEIPWGGTLVLEEGSILQGTVRVGADVLADGQVNASNANLELDISMRKEEYGTLLSDLTLLAASSYTVLVDPDQNKGGYILAGNAQDFRGAITVKGTDGSYRGSLTVDQGTLDYGMTRYSLDLNDNNDLVFSVSSTFEDETDYILLYKDIQIILAKESVSNLTVSREGKYDQINVLDKGVAEWISIGNGGVAEVEAGGHLRVSGQHRNGILRFDYTAGDSTVIKGTNKNGEYFFVENDRMENVCGENVNVRGNVTIRDYYGQGTLMTRDGVTLTGIAEGGYYHFYGTNIHDFKLTDGSAASFYDGTVVLNTEWDSYVGIYNDVFFDHAVFHWHGDVYGGTVSDAVFRSSVSLHGGTLSDVVFNSGVNVYGYMHVEGDLVFRQAPFYDFKGSEPYFDMKGHNAIFDYTDRFEDDAAMIMLDAFSEDVVFQLNMNRDQIIGKYVISKDRSLECDPAIEGRIAPGARRGLVDTFNICIDGNIIGTIDGDHPEFVSGNYVYRMTCEDETELFLTIGISDNADDTYDILWYDTDKTLHHSASASLLTIGTDAGCFQAIVRDGGVLGGAELGDGGILKVYAGGQVADLVQKGDGILRFDYAEGDSTAITGSNQYGRFTVRNNVMDNVYGENVTVTGGVEIHNYHGCGLLTTRRLDAPGSGMNHITLTGAADGGEYTLYDTDIYDFVLESAQEFNHYSGTIHNAVFDGGTVYLRGKGTVSDTVFNTYVGLFDGTYSNVELNSEYRLYGEISLAGDITLRAQGSYVWNSIIQVNGHTVNADYTNRTTYDPGLLSIRLFSEDANFRLMFRDDQKTGTYTIAEDTGSLIDYFLINIGGVDTEVLSAQHMEMDYGDYHYTLAHNAVTQRITLTISATGEAAEEMNVSYTDSTGETTYYAESLDGFVFVPELYPDVRVKDQGFVSNSELGRGGSMTVEAGGKVFTLEQEEGSRLIFDYAENDTTVITGINPNGAFFAKNNLLENIYGANITVTGNVLVNKYHNAGGVLTVDGGTVSGQFDGSGSITVGNGVVTGFTGNDSQSYSVSQSFVEYAEFNGPVSLCGGTYSEVIVNGEWFIDGIVSLDGDMTFKTTGRRALDANGSLGYEVSQWSNSCISGNGRTIIFDLTDRTVADSALLSLSRVYNTEIQVKIDQKQPIGTYTLAVHASQIGLKDFTGVLDQETNQWLFQGATVGDIDNIVTVYDINGIELASCTVNGDTEYYGRYNYTVFVDENGNLKLKVGWNNREGLTYAVDEKEENDSLETATVIAGSGKDAIRNLTIHSDSDVDYFKFNLESFGRKSSYIGIEFKQWAGDLDINLYNSNGELIDYARSVTDNERLSLSGYTAGTYYLMVSGYNGNTNSYKLIYDLPETIEMNDDYETGDTHEVPYFLNRLEGQMTINANISRSNDLDYYMFVLPEKGLVSDVISLSYDDEFGDLDLYLYDQDGTTLLISSTNTVGGQERITMAGLQSGVYYAAVKSKDGSIGRYDLVFDVNSHEVNPDKYEGNDTMKKATKLYTLNGKKTLDGLSIHSDEDVDYYKFSILEKGSADDSVTLTCEPSLGDLDIEILNADGEVVAYSRTAEIDDVVELKGLAVGEYYIRVYGYNNVANNYSLSWNVTNSALIPADPYEGNGAILIRENQTVTGLSISKPREDDETRADTFKIVLEYDAWKRSKIILTDYRSDWEDGMSYVVKDAAGTVLMEGKDSEISLYGLKKGEYYLTLDTPNEDEYSEYSLIAQNLPDSDHAKDNSWSIFIYMAADNNLENCLMKELLFMQSAVLPEDVEVYVLMDRAKGGSVSERDWSDTRVGKLRHSKGKAVAIEWMYFDGVNTNTYADTHNTDQKKEWDTGDVKTLEAFLDWGMQEGRAENYALILTDHGSSLGYNNVDGTSGSIMNIQDIADLLKQDKYDALSVAAFEQCEMGSDVVVTTMEGTVDYVVASEAIGWVPNWMIMYDVLLNSLETEMTPRELSQKIVDSCNCSGYFDLTMASFKTADNTLSDALNQFGELASEFTYSDWIALCKCFSKVHNYGDEICAYSDLGSLLNQIKGYRETVSSTLLDATNALYDTVMNTVIDSTKITPEIYGTGLAVFNPVLSDPMMATYSYGGDNKLDYYATSIGKSAWGSFMYTLSRMAEDCSDYIVDANGSLTFTDYSYYYYAGEVRNSYNLGAFSGNGVSFAGLYMDESAYFDVTLMKPGEEGDAIVITADNPNADITVYLVQTLIPADKQIANGSKPYPAVRRIAEDGVLSLAGVDYDKNRAFNEYHLVITSTEETTYNLEFVGNWTTGVDYFDYSRTKSISALAAGNNSIEKATVLANGNYGGLVTSVGDKDFYKVLSVYADTLNVTVKGTNIIVQEFNEAGELLQTAVEEDGLYKLTVANENYLCVEGMADISANECNPYTLSISEAAQTYLTAELGAMLPEKPVVTSQLIDNTVAIDVVVEDGLEAFYSKDLQSWDKYEGNLVADENGRYYFKSVDTATELESKYVSLRVVGIDHVAPTVSNVAADVTTPTNTGVTVTAEFADDVALASSLYRIGEDGEWMDYVDGVTVKDNTTVFFMAIDLAGNESEIVSYEVTNIDKVAPLKPTASADVTTVTNGDVFVSATFSDDSVVKEYSLDGQVWKTYTDAIQFTVNGTVSFRGTDAAGNVSDVTDFSVNNIDKVAPVKPTASADVTALTNGDVTVTAEFSEDSVVKEYSTDGGETWKNYNEGGVIIIMNSTVLFRGTDAAGNVSEVTSYTVDNIDKVAPVAPITSADVMTATNGNVLVSAVFSEDSAVKEYSLDGGETWKAYTEAVNLSDNGTVSFRGTDAAGNVSEITSYTVDNIDKIAPIKPSISADITTPTNTDVTVSAVFSEDSAVKEYSLDGGETWKAYTEAVKFTENGSVSFRGTDAAGNVSEVTSYTVENIDKEPPVISLAGDNTTPLQTSTLTASTEDGLDIFYSTDNATWMKYEGRISVTENVTYYFKATDAAGNTGTAEYVFANIQPVSPSHVEPRTHIWEQTEDAAQYIVEYSTDDFKHVIRLAVDTNSLDSFQMPAGNYQWRVRTADGGEWTDGDPVEVPAVDNGPKLIKSDADGNADVFFVNASGTWGSLYAAQHTGSTNDVWGGTGEHAVLYGRNKLTDVIEGSTDANILLMTDDANGDTLFVDDIYSASPDELGLSQSRIAQIDEIRAGAGNDIVDMTSDRFEYTGDGLTIRGGDGNDTIWANKGNNGLFGDAGNDRLVGASGNDVIAGGIGNDRMHGGGGNDMFTFCENWGVDNVEQLATGSVTLWFAESKSQITASELDGNSVFTNAAGTASVTVKGFALADIVVKYGDDGSDDYVALAAAGAFFDATTERIFEESGKGILASL